MHKQIHALANSYRLLLAGLLLAVTTVVVAASGVYMEPEEFLAGGFAEPPAAPRVLWISGTLREQVSEILSHPPGSARQRYWQSGPRTAWILNEIGKEQPITAGFIVEHGKIISASVLSFRESRGWEIRNPAFTQQFNGAGLQGQRLNKDIDGISGATLSVRAMEKMSRLALLYHAEVMRKQASTTP